MIKFVLLFCLGLIGGEGFGATLNLMDANQRLEFMEKMFGPVCKDKSLSTAEKLAEMATNCIKAGVLDRLDGKDGTEVKGIFDRKILGKTGQELLHIQVAYAFYVLGFGNHRNEGELYGKLGFNEDSKHLFEAISAVVVSANSKPNIYTFELDINLDMLGAKNRGAKVEIVNPRVACEVITPEVVVVPPPAPPAVSPTLGGAPTSGTSGSKLPPLVVPEDSAYSSSGDTTHAPPSRSVSPSSKPTLSPTASPPRGPVSPAAVGSEVLKPVADPVSPAAVNPSDGPKPSADPVSPVAASGGDGPAGVASVDLGVRSALAGLFGPGGPKPNARALASVAATKGFLDDSIKEKLGALKSSIERKGASASGEESLILTKIDQLFNDASLVDAQTIKSLKDQVSDLEALSAPSDEQKSEIIGLKYKILVFQRKILDLIYSLLNNLDGYKESMDAIDATLKKQGEERYYSEEELNGFMSQPKAKAYRNFKANGSPASAIRSTLDLVRRGEFDLYKAALDAEVDTDKRKADILARSKKENDDRAEALRKAEAERQKKIEKESREAEKKGALKAWLETKSSRTGDPFDDFVQSKVAEYKNLEDKEGKKVSKPQNVEEIQELRDASGNVIYDSKTGKPKQGGRIVVQKNVEVDALSSLEKSRLTGLRSMLIAIMEYGDGSAEINLTAVNQKIADIEIDQKKPGVTSTEAEKCLRKISFLNVLKEQFVNTPEEPLFANLKRYYWFSEKPGCQDLVKFLAEEIVRLKPDLNTKVSGGAAPLAKSTSTKGPGLSKPPSVFDLAKDKADSRRNVLRPQETNDEQELDTLRQKVINYQASLEDMGDLKDLLGDEITHLEDHDGSVLETDEAQHSERKNELKLLKQKIAAAEAEVQRLEGLGTSLSEQDKARLEFLMRKKTLVAPTKPFVAPVRPVPLVATTVKPVPLVATTVKPAPVLKPAAAGAGSTLDANTSDADKIAALRDEITALKGKKDRGEASPAEILRIGKAEKELKKLQGKK